MRSRLPRRVFIFSRRRKRFRPRRVDAEPPENRLCDAPGSWYCPGQYPPALAKFTGIIKPAYEMPEFAKRRIEEREKIAAKAKAEKAEMAAKAEAEKAEAEESAEGHRDAKEEL